MHWLLIKQNEKIGKWQIGIGLQNGATIIKNGMHKSQSGKLEWGNQNATNIVKSGMGKS